MRSYCQFHSPLNRTLTVKLLYPAHLDSNSNHNFVEFELGELAGTIGDILLMGKKSLQFHSHKCK